jgi:hypothetical protein
MALRGQCLCGDVQFELDGPIRGIGQCHCSLCRRVSGTNGNAIFLVPAERFRWLVGEDRRVHFRLRPTYGVSRCVRCGSPLPDCLDGRQYWVQAGLMQDDLDTEIKLHIHVGSKADWDRIPEHHPQFEGYPPGHPLAPKTER